MIGKIYGNAGFDSWQKNVSNNIDESLLNFRY